ncbi:MAG: SDR family oxidoreductase [Planctomycetota bacterium]
MARILVAGCGDVGSEFARRAIAEGHVVHGLRRSARPLPEGVRGLRGDVGDPATLRDLPADLDAVVYAVAADERSDAAYERAYPVGLRNVLEAVRARITADLRVVFLSSTGVYGQTDGSRVDESSPTEPTSFTGTRLVEAERLLAERPVRGTSLRLGGIYGPGRTYLVDSVRAGRATYPEEGPGWTNRIHRDDAARAILFTLRLDDPPAALNVVDPNPTRRREVLEWLAERIGAPTPVSAPGAARGGDKRVDSSRLETLGFTFDHPSFREGYAELLSEHE